MKIRVYMQSGLDDSEFHVDVDVNNASEADEKAEVIAEQYYASKSTWEVIDDIATDREFGTEVYYCQTCNCNSLGYYQNELCPVCGEKMIRMRYVITETKDGGKCTIKIKPQVI